MVKLIYLDGEYYQLVRQIDVKRVMGNMEGLKVPSGGLRRGDF